MGDYLTTREAFQGLILPDSRWQPWTAETTATSAGGRPSITSSSALQLATVDVDRGAPGQTLTLECERQAFQHHLTAIRQLATLSRTAATAQSWALTSHCSSLESARLSSAALLGRRSAWPPPAVNACGWPTLMEPM